MSKDIVRKYIQGQPDPIDREILALAIFLPLLDGQKGATAKEIRAVLVGHHKNVPSVRAIQVRIAKHRAALRSILELVEPDQRESPET